MVPGFVLSGYRPWHGATDNPSKRETAPCFLINHVKTEFADCFGQTDTSS